MHAFQRPDAEHVELDETATSLSRACGVVRLRQDRRREDPLQLQLRATRARASTSTTWVSSGAPTSAYISNWFQMRDNVPGRFTRSFIWNLNQWAGWNFDGDRLFSGGNVNMHWTWKNYSTSGFGVNSTPRRCAIASHAAGPAVLGNTSVSVWYYSAATAARTCLVRLQRLSRSRRQGHDAPQHRALRQLASDQRVVDHDRVPLQHQQRRFAVGGERGRWTGSRRATCSAG